MKVLVTGATGFLGGRIARLLCDQGLSVRASGLPGDHTDVIDDLPCEFHPFDLLDAAAARRATKGVEAVFHVAAMVTLRPELYDRQMRVNAQGTRHVLDAARDAGVRRFVHTSSVNTLGIPPEGRTGDEDTPFDWGPYRLGYMDSKRAAERLVLEAAAKGLDAVCALPVTLFGPGDINFSAGTYIRESARGHALLAPPGGTTITHVDDAARGHLLALERGRRGERYILGGEYVSYRTLFDWIADELHVRRPLATIPPSPLILAGRLCDALRDRLGLAMPFSEGLAKAACSELRYSAAKAESELGYRSRPAREGVRDAVDWYRARGLV